MDNRGYGHVHPEATPLPACPLLTSPDNGAHFGQPGTVPLNWGSVASADEYNVFVWLSTDDEPETPTATVVGTTYNATVADNVAYNWKVTSVNDVGESFGCGVRTFYTYLSNTALESIIVAASDQSSALTAGTGKFTFRMPYAFHITEVRLSLQTAQASGNRLTADVRASGTTIFSTLPSIDNTEKTSVTSSIPAVLSTTDIADNTEMRLDVTQVGNGTAIGLVITFLGYQI